MYISFLYRLCVTLDVITCETWTSLRLSLEQEQKRWVVYCNNHCDTKKSAVQYVIITCFLKAQIHNLPYIWKGNISKCLFPPNFWMGKYSPIFSSSTYGTSYYGYLISLFRHKHHQTRYFVMCLLMGKQEIFIFREQSWSHMVYIGWWWLSGTLQWSQSLWT